jgi:glycosyl transferase, family 25
MPLPAGQVMNILRSLPAAASRNLDDNFMNVNADLLGNRHPLEYFSRIIIINLKSRPDRRRQLQEELDRINLRATQVEWFAAIRPDTQEPFDSIGAKGCFLSHLSILDAAAEQNLPRVLLLEDDVDFERDFNQRMAQIVEDLQRTPWDMFYGGGRTGLDLPATGGVIDMAPEIPIGCAHFVAFQGKAIRQVRDYLKAQLGRPRDDPAGGPMHVDGSYCWARRELSLRTLMATPDLCQQRSSRSDILGARWWDKTPGVSTAVQVLRNTKRWMNKSAAL